jgi:CBS domain-containing protein/ribosome-associated translation inhibitor RaiA
MAKTLEELASTGISDYVTRHMSVFDPGDTASRVLGELKETGRYEALISSGTKVGLVTVRDLLDVDQSTQTKIEGLWRTLTPIESENTFRGVAEALISDNMRAFPVVEHRKLVGIISQIEIVAAMVDVPELNAYPAKDYVKRPVATLASGEKVAQARRMMLERGISHVPIVDSGKLIGVVTAMDIVHTFVTPGSRMAIGDKTGEKLTRFPGQVNGVMDDQPLTIGPNASIHEAVKGMRDRGKSACVMVDENGILLGILTPREVLVILKGAEPEELPVSILGLEGEGFFEKGVAEEKVRRVVARNMRIHPDINQVSIRIRRQQNSGERARYQIVARVLSPTEQFNASTEGWDLLASFDDLLEALDATLKRAKREQPKTARRRRGRK